MIEPAAPPLAASPEVRALLSRAAAAYAICRAIAARIAAEEREREGQGQGEMEEEDAA